MLKNNEDIRILFGRRIKELRVKKGLTQEKLSELINIGERNLSKIECGKTFVTSETLSKLIDALDADAADVFNFEHNKDLYQQKEELISAIKEDKVDISLMYRFYKSIR